MTKRRMLRIILIAIPAILVLFLVVVAMKPAHFRVERVATINAAPNVVFPYVNELKKWEGWNPWGKLDPNMKLAYEGPASGVGASYAWAGNRNVGEGKMTATESSPNERVRFKLEFYKPMAGVCDATFTFRPQGGQTEVTWTMTGTNNFIAKVMCTFMDMDRMVGGQFEKGLAELKTLAERAPGIPAGAGMLAPFSATAAN